MANGQVTTGFSKPYVASYSNSGTTITYTGCMALGRGVNVSISAETSDDNKFYADNQAAEAAPARFTGGEASVTIDGMLAAAEKFIFGLPTAGTDGWTQYGDTADTPYVGFGFIRRVQSAGVISFQPIVIPKCKFAYAEDSAATQEENIEWQTQALTASIFRDDSANHNWKLMGALFTVDGSTYTSEAAAEAAAETALKTKLGYTAPGGGGGGASA